MLRNRIRFTVGLEDDMAGKPAYPDPGRRIKPTAAGHKDCTVSCISNALRRRDPTARQTDIRIATVSVPAFRTE